MSTNYLLRNTFWEERYEQLDKELKLHLQSLYSWALLVNKIIDEKNQWIKDKKIITGKKHPLAGQPIGIKEKAIANSIVQFIINGKLDVNLPSAILNTNEDPNIEVEIHNADTNTNNETDSDAETITESEAELTREQQITNKLMRQHEDEQAELDRLINEKRNNMLEKQKNLMDNVQDQRPVKFNLDVVAQPEEQNKLDDIQERGDNLDTEVLSDACRSALKKADEVKRAIEAQNNPTNQDSEPADNKVALEVAKAPTINALYRLDNWEREDLLERLFIKAEKNVKSLANANTPPKEMEELVHREMNRLLDVYMQTH